MATTKFEPHGKTAPVRPDTKPLATLLSSNTSCKDIYKWVRPVVKAPLSVYMPENFDLDPRSDAVSQNPYPMSSMMLAWERYVKNEDTGSESKLRRMIQGMAAEGPYNLPSTPGPFANNLKPTCSQHAIVSNTNPAHFLASTIHDNKLTMVRGLTLRFADAMVSSKLKDTQLLPADPLSVHSFYLGMTQDMDASRPFLPATPLKQRIQIQGAAKDLRSFQRPLSVPITRIDPLSGPFNRSNKTVAIQRNNQSTSKTQNQDYANVPPLGSKPLHFYFSSLAPPPPASDTLMEDTLRMILPDTEYMLPNIQGLTLGQLLQGVEPLAVYQANIPYGTYKTMAYYVGRDIRQYMGSVMRNKRERFAMLQPVQRYFSQTQLNICHGCFSGWPRRWRTFTASSFRRVRCPFHNSPVRH